MNGMEKSDLVIVAVKSANNGTRVPAEPMEPRTEPKGNPGSQSTCRTQSRESVTQAADRIRQFVQREPRERLTALLHHVTVDALRWAFFELKRNAAAGADGMTWRMYEDGLEGRLADLHDRVHSGAYRATPSRRVNIPKPDGGTRPLGVAAIEDKIVQKAVAEIILTPIYEAEFLGFSYGFRPGRGAHDALDALAVGIRRRKTNWVVDCDIRAFFDMVSRDWLVRFLEHRIGDKRVIRLIVKWLNAGVMEDGEWRDDLRGTPQGSVISTILSNIYLHYVLDLWFHRKWRSREVNGDSIIVRYADDFVAGFQHKRDAERFLDAVKERFGNFGLELHPDKTRLIEFGRFAQSNRRKQGQADRKPLNSWASRTTARRPGEGISVGAQAGCEADGPHAEADKGSATQADALQTQSDGEMAGKGARRMAELLRGPEQLPIPATFRHPPEAALAAIATPKIAEGLHYLGQHYTTSGSVLAQAGNQTPVAERTADRQLDPREEPDALTGTSGSARGASGNRRPYRNPPRWRCLRWDRRPRFR